MKSPAQNNRDVAEELLRAGRERRQAGAMKPPDIAPEVTLRKQIEAAKRDMANGADVGERLLELRRRHYDLTGASGG